MENNFNHDFYVTVATVVPLLYITLFLQGQQVQDFGKKLGGMIDKSSEGFGRILGSWSEGKFQLKHIWEFFWLASFASFGIGGMFYAVLVTMAAGPVAIGYSFWALFYRSDVHFMRVIVLLSTVGLLLLVCLNPIGSIVRNMRNPVRSNTEEGSTLTSPNTERGST